ncbi:adenylyl-sulfate kinase [Spirosoma utsteinense]|uniref:Adenylyl-sulfate kinase n=1 Tax=Spirosoma utsteinense TaxID=2585773 RepID=A0ABR6WCN0_9BACT|nr:adenylyl-sulfate kinase [Spirosoma utsteinense]MBC3788356.1 adenylylsulfate kinase [Spirosoma utsteinense]MBC3794273.1 adenylylsulfate kinase [Spirosoma utsteinense]
MLFIQFTGLSGAGKSTLSKGVAERLTTLGYRVEVLDGDRYRRHLWPELTFSAQDRQENIRRLGFIGQRLVHHGVIVILAAINPYKSVRDELAVLMPGSRLVFIDCALPTLQQRDTKGLYARALLPQAHADHITNLTGVNDPYDRPETPDLHIDTSTETREASEQRLLNALLTWLKTTSSDDVN